MTVEFALMVNVIFWGVPSGNHKTVKVTKAGSDPVVTVNFGVNSKTSDGAKKTEPRTLLTRASLSPTIISVTCPTSSDSPNKNRKKTTNDNESLLQIICFPQQKATDIPSFARVTVFFCKTSKKKIKIKN